jgi:hypothetical protein
MRICKKKCRLLECDVVWLLLEPTFRGNISPPSSQKRNSELGTTLAVTSKVLTLMMEAIRSSETSVLIRATQRHIPEDGILHNNRRETLKFNIALTGWALQQRRKVFPVRYKQGFYIPEDDILSHSLDFRPYTDKDRPDLSSERAH